MYSFFRWVIIYDERASWNNVILAVEESSSDDDSDEESEKAAATGEGGAEGEEAPNYRSGYGSGDEKK